MCRTPFTARINGRYVFRRRVHFRNIISKPLTIALQTADPKAARQRSAILAARFVMVKVKVEGMLETGPALTSTQIEGIFRNELERELEFYVHSAYEQASWSSSVTEVAAEIGEAARIMRRPDGWKGMTEADEARLRESGKGHEISSIRGYINQFREMMTDDLVAQCLTAVGAPVHAQNISAARTHLLRAQSVAAQRIQRVHDDDVLDAPDPISALTADLGPRSAGIVVPLARRQVAETPAPEANRDCQFLVHVKVRFSQAIDEVLADLKREGVWKGGVSQQRRIMETFAWITGDKMLGDYNHLDVAAFKKGLLQLPKKFRYGSLTTGAMARPFTDVIAELPKLGEADKRHLKTLNRDLSVMQTVSKHLEQSHWKARTPDALVLNFGKSRTKIKRSGNARPPWQKQHLECLFRSPIYTGGGGALHRLKADGAKLGVWHDAAYFAPLIWYYTAACREEICGLEIRDVILDHETPHFHIRDNRTRGRDGDLAGEKTEARNRLLPIPTEVLRLGFRDYVRALGGDGYSAVFSELYCNEEKRGGGFFYDRAWQHMVSYIADRMPLPALVNGKGADIHSIRSLGSSFYEVDGVNDIIRADVMGHARHGTNAEFYSQREKTEGTAVILAERLAFMNRYVPNITSHLQPTPIRLLPLENRSRVGSPRGRKTRNDAGSVRAQATGV